MTNVHVAKTYTTFLSGGIVFALTKCESGHSHESLSVNVEWANGEDMETFSELSLNPSDMAKLSDLFRTVAMEVNA
jgi:hypothetical protein